VRQVLLVVAAGMLSKRRRQGKHRNILLAMPQARSRWPGISLCKNRQWHSAARMPPGGR